MIVKIACATSSDPAGYARHAFDPSAGRFTRYDGSPITVIGVTLSEDGHYAMVEIEGNELAWME